MFCPISGEIRCRCLDKKEKVTAFKVDIKSTFRKLWSDYLIYIISLINSVVDGNRNNQYLEGRLFDNQDDIVNQMELVANNFRKDEIKNLLEEHIKCVSNVIEIISNKEEERKINVVSNLLFDNGRRISLFLSLLANGKIREREISVMLDRHNNFIIDIVESRLQKNYQEQIKFQDQFYLEILHMSDTIVSIM